MDFFNNLSGCELISLAAILAVSISQDLSSDKINILGSFFTVLGDNLSAIGATQTNSSDNNQCNENSKE